MPFLFLFMVAIMVTVTITITIAAPIAVSVSVTVVHMCCILLLIIIIMFSLLHRPVVMVMLVLLVLLLLILVTVLVFVFVVLVPFLLLSLQFGHIFVKHLPTLFILKILIRCRIFKQLHTRFIGCVLINLFYGLQLILELLHHFLLLLPGLLLSAFELVLKIIIDGSNRGGLHSLKLAVSLDGLCEFIQSCAWGDDECKVLHDLLDHLFVLLDTVLQIHYKIVKQLLFSALLLHGLERRVVLHGPLNDFLPLGAVVELPLLEHRLQQLPELVSDSALLLLLLLGLFDLILFIAPLHVPDVVLEHNQSIFFVQGEVPGIFIQKLLHLSPLGRHFDALRLLQQLSERGHVLLAHVALVLPSLSVQIHHEIFKKVFSVPLSFNGGKSRITFNIWNSLLV
mmetsp:Transcript_12209/g.18705  ORF Transcript_12209/g.18705 Transcript_12209/m.18705 type:complete len:396 (+) Transcript_12209:959-2146(+)